MLNSDDEDDDDKKEKEKSENQSSFAESKLIKTRAILLTGEVNKELADRIIKHLLILQAEDSEKPIKVFIDSPGGDLYAGFAIYDMLRFVTPKIYTIGMGLVASAASLILLSSPSERRLALPNSAYLIHQPLISGVIKGVSSDIEIQAIEIEKSRKKLDELISRETGKTLKEVESHTERDYWLDSDEALKYNLVSKIISKQTELDAIINS